MRYDTVQRFAACLLSIPLVACEGSLPTAAEPVAGSNARSAPDDSNARSAPDDSNARSTPDDSNARSTPDDSSTSLPPMAAKTSACSSYTVALRVRADMSWPETIGLVGAQGTLTFWAKQKHTPEADGGETLDTAPCGVSLPVVTTSPLLDGVRLLNEIPTASFDLPSMPHTTSRASWREGKLVSASGPVLLGVALPDASAAWPERGALNAADHDADGAPGITAFPRNGDGFGLPPADIGQIEHVDRVYIAARIELLLSAAETSCAGPVEGTVEPLGFDYSIVGCHLQGGGDCKAEQANLLYNNSPEFTLGAHGTFASIPIAEQATCEEIIAALPALD